MRSDHLLVCYSTLSTQTKSGVGAVCWMAPESIATRNYSPKSDVWSFGITGNIP